MCHPPGMMTMSVMGEDMLDDAGGGMVWASRRGELGEMLAGCSGAWSEAREESMEE